MNRLILLSVLSFALACAQNQTDLISIIRADGNYSTVSTLLTLAGPFNTSGIFLSAFVAKDSNNSLPAAVFNFQNLPRKVLSYGVFPERIDFTAVDGLNGTDMDAQVFATLNSLDNSSGPVYFTFRNGSTFFNNYILFNRTGIEVSDGILYPLNKFPLADFTLENFVKLFNDSVLEKGWEALDFEDLDDLTNFTLFAPSNAAFDSLITRRTNSTDSLADLKSSLGRQGSSLHQVLRYHYISNTYSFLNLTNDQLLPTKLNGSFIRVNIYNNDVFTVNGKEISNGGWVKTDDENDRDMFEGPFEDSLELFSKRVGFFFQLNDVLIPPTFSAYQYIGNATNFTQVLSEETSQQLSSEAITVFWVNSTGNLTIFITNGTTFLPGLFTGSYETIVNGGSNFSFNVNNDGKNVTFATPTGNYFLEKSVLVTNGVVHVLIPYVPSPTDPSFATQTVIVTASEGTGVVSSVSGGISSAIDSASEGISSAVDSASGVASSASGGISSAVDSASGGISSAVDSASGGITSAVSSASGGISSAVDSASGGISSAVDSASGGISSAVDSASAILSSIFSPFGTNSK